MSTSSASASRYIIGIDLGTTNCALAYADTGEPVNDDQPHAIRPFAVPQITKPGVIENWPLLPSFLFLPAAAEADKLDLSLPWGKRSFAVGLWARERGADRPGCVVSSAKSWLCHAGVNRTDALLPWQTTEAVEKVSPVDVSARYLRHLREAFDHVNPPAKKTAGIGEAELVLTIPASFDAVARELTNRAATEAGFKQVTLLEEPQAAFYAWLHRHHATWRKEIKPGHTVLVIDIGGGTTDFSLITVREKNGDLALERLAVGEHTLVGGDNMDLLLAHTLAQRVEKGGKKLDPLQFASLVRAACRAKEKLLSGELKSAPISILGSGSKLIGGTVKVDLTREDVEQLLVDGFFPRCKLSDAPQRTQRLGLRTAGLPYAQDAAITRHLAEFLSRSGAAAPDALKTAARPTHVLFNGGVIKGQKLRDRIISVVQEWFATDGGPAIKVLDDAELELGAAMGAVAFGLIRRGGKGVRIRGGVSQTYYVGIASSVPAVPGVPPPLRALCVLPAGTEEGSTVPLPKEHEFELVVGETVEFPFLASPIRKKDTPGLFVDDLSEITELARLSLKFERPGLAEATAIPVRLQVQVTDIGTLEVWCLAVDGSGQWKLELNVRND